MSECPDKACAATDRTEEVLGEVEKRIRGQADIAPMGSMEWRAHMADLAHVEAVKMELRKGTSDE